jgi:hypothetical protein
MANLRVLQVGFARTQSMTCRNAGDGEEVDGSLGPGYTLGSVDPPSPFVSSESVQLCQRMNQECPFYGPCAKKLQSTTRRNPTAHHQSIRGPALTSRDCCAIPQSRRYLWPIRSTGRHQVIVLGPITSFLLILCLLMRSCVSASRLARSDQQVIAHR